MLKKLQLQMSDAAFYQQDPSLITATKQQLIELQNELKKAYARWELLES